MENITRIGKTNFRNTNQIFGIKEKDRSGHIYCIGKTGVGKSTLLLNMAIADIHSGKGVGIIDPHGDLSESILDYIPNERIKDVIYVTGCDTSYPIAFNPLYNIKQEERHLVASNIISTLKRIWAESWGPRLEHILRNTILTLVHYPHATLLDIQPLLLDFDFRKKVLQFVTDTALLDFWYNEFNSWSPQFKSEAISPIVNKVGLFQTHTHLRNIVGQERSSFTITDVMNQKKIFIANLSKGHLGEDATTLLGSMLVTQFQAAAIERSIKRQWGFYYVTTKKSIRHASEDVGLMFVAFNLRRLMNIIDKNSFKKFLKELVPVVFRKKSLVNVIAGILSPGNFINRFLQSNYINAHSSLKLNYI